MSDHDIDSALAQAHQRLAMLERRLQVEEALDRIRARALAMRRSDELASVASVLLREQRALGIEAWRSGVGITRADESAADVWTATSSPEGDDALQLTFHIPLHGHPTVEGLYDAWKRQTDFYTYDLSGEALEEYVQFMADHQAGPLAGEQAEPTAAFSRMVFHFFPVPEGALSVVAATPLPDAAVQVMRRIANVFSFAYTRYLDLKQAEEQAREAQIEAALERVRARSMAMHHSDELREVVAVLFEQIQPLGFESWGCTIMICDEAARGMECWYSGDAQAISPQSYHLPLFDHPLTQTLWKTWKEQVPYLAYENTGALKRSYDDLVFEQTEFKHIPEAIKAEIRAMDTVFSSYASMRHGLLATWSSQESLPDDQAAILQRFARVFEQTYTRFLDLKQAEEQAREAQIEAALERVRARSMAMHRSEELPDVAVTVFEQLAGLGLDTNACWFLIIDEEAQHLDLWATTYGAGTVYPSRIPLPWTGNPQVEENVAAWKSGVPLFTYTFEGEAVEAQFEALTRLSGDHFTEVLEAMPERIEHTEACHTYGTLGISTREPVPTAYQDILQRFARVFEQTYTRFLDLKQAEAQAREAQIEAALERVRSRAMAMHRSDELAEVIAVVFAQLQSLGFGVDTCSIEIIQEETQDMQIWYSSVHQPLFAQSTLLPASFWTLNHPFVARRLEAIEQEETFYTEVYSHEEKNSLLQWLFEHSDFKYLPEERKAYVLERPGYARSNALTKHGLLNTQNYEGEPYSAEEDAILQRFARVFEQTYTRFLDLRQAEEQAREAQIEAALERVRARSMGMRHSDELSEVASVVFEQFEGLGLNPVYAGVAIIEDEAGYADLWLTAFRGGVNPVRIQLPLTGHPQVEKNMVAWRRGDPFLSWVVEGKEAVQAQAEAYAAFTGDPHFLHASPAERQEHLEACHTYGTLSIVSFEAISAETGAILQRFARVFEQTYTRFLDLKKAEEQAREAQIEAALERVRAKAMAMHHSNELLDVVAVIFKEMQHLGFETSLCSIAIIDAETGDSVWWQSDETHSVLPQSYRVPHLDHPWWKRLVETWRQGVPFFSLELAGETKRSLDAIFFTETDYKDLPEESKAMMMGAERSMQSYASMNHGLLEMMTEEPLSDGQIDILQRFANVIDLTYTRFDDLQQAEARAREAVRQASLDRVRAEIASMRTAADLQRITPLVWRELTTLGVPFFRCGVIIADEASGEVEMFLSNNYGEQLAALRLPFESHPLIQNAVATWRNRQVFTDQWEQERLVAWVDFLMDRGQVATSEEYMDRDGPPPSLAIHLVPFAQGLLYVGSAEPLADDQVDLVQALADAFAVAYARYADFKQLEAAKADVEAALDHLKMTQNQLIQSEKMASLGALTAGIAHEIKNPLNFVNNFSQLSVELAEELRQEIETHRDKTLAEVAADLAEILDDLALNAEKIHEHGARADGIVKSMMQHARGGEGERRATDVNALVEEYVNLAYHGMRAATPDFNVTLECDYDEAAGEAELVPQEIGRVFINLFNNAFFAVYEEARAGDEAYTPVVTVATHRTEDAVTIRVQDNGPGIPEAVREKIFEPFFTTKPTGQGTGLGLSISYDIVTQGHGGTLVVEGAEGGGVVFTITLPA